MDKPKTKKCYIRDPVPSGNWQLKTMQSHIQSYLSRTSAHGFSRLVERSNGDNFGKFRPLWAAAILFSFCTSGYLIMSSLDEIERSPIATNIEYVSVQVMNTVKH